MRKNLRVAIKTMEKTRGETDPVAELRRWRLEAAKRFVSLSLPKKGKGK